MNVMILSPVNSGVLKALLQNALTDKIYDLQIFMIGIDYSYYYEENE